MLYFFEFTLNLNVLGWVPHGMTICKGVVSRLGIVILDFPLNSFEVNKN